MQNNNESGVIVDNRKTGFFTCYNKIFSCGLDVYEIACYTYLCSLIGRSKGDKVTFGGKTMFPSYETIANKIQCSEKKAFTTISSLINKNIIKKRKRSHKSNIYSLECIENWSVSFTDKTHMVVPHTTDDCTTYNHEVVPRTTYQELVYQEPAYQKPEEYNAQEKKSEVPEKKQKKEKRLTDGKAKALPWEKLIYSIFTKQGIDRRVSSYYIDILKKHNVSVTKPQVISWFAQKLKTLTDTWYQIMYLTFVSEYPKCGLLQYGHCGEQHDYFYNLAITARHNKWVDDGTGVHWYIYKDPFDWCKEMPFESVDAHTFGRSSEKYNNAYMPEFEYRYEKEKAKR